MASARLDDRGWIDMQQEMARLTLDIVGTNPVRHGHRGRRRAGCRPRAYRCARAIQPSLLAVPADLRTIAASEHATLRPRARRVRPDDLFDDRASPGRGRGRRGSAVPSSSRVRRRNGMTDVQVRDEAITLFLAGSRDHVERAHVDLVPAVAARGRRGGAPRRAGRRSGSTRSDRCRRPVVARHPARCCPRRCGCFRPPGPWVGARRSTRSTGTSSRKDRSSWFRRGCCTATSGGGRSRTRSAWIAGPMTPPRPDRGTRSSRSAAALGCASAKASRGWRAELLIATIARRWRFELDPVQEIALQPVVTLRPKHGIRMRAVARRALSVRDARRLSRRLEVLRARERDRHRERAAVARRALHLDAPADRLEQARDDVQAHPTPP